MAQCDTIVNASHGGAASLWLWRQDSGGLGAAQGFAAIAERFGDMDAGDALLAIKVRKSSPDPERPMIAART